MLKHKLDCCEAALRVTMIAIEPKILKTNEAVLS